MSKSDNDESARALMPLLDAVCEQARSPAATALVFDWILQHLVRLHHSEVFWGDRMLILDRSAEFLRDPCFLASMASADSSTGANQYQSPGGIAWRYHTLIWAARSCLALPGDYVECGVYRGDMTWVVTENVDLRSAGKTFFIYDTFAGFNLEYSSPADFPDNPAFFDFADQAYKAPGIEADVRRRFSSKPEVVITKGTVPNVLYSGAPAAIAFLHLDMNSPAAELGALEVLFDRVTPGGIVVFDDYGWAFYRKQKQTADSFVNARSHFIMELPTGQGLLIKR